MLPLDLVWLLLAATVFAVGAFCLLTLYNLFFHPLRSYPGPWYTGASILWYQLHVFKGDLPFVIHSLHRQYGPVVRIAPNELSYTDVRAWKDIYGHRLGVPEFAKDPSQNFEGHAHPSIIHANREQHAALRRLLSHAFSDKSLREQEPVLHSYVHMLIERLREHSESGPKALDLVNWYNFTTFDIIGHLAFAEPFDCLSSSAYHPWVSLIYDTIKFITFLRALNRFHGSIAGFLQRLIPDSLRRKKDDNWQLTKEKVLRRRARNLDYTDFMTPLLTAEEKGVLDLEDLISNGPTLVVAGRETTAALLSGATFYLLSDKSVYARVTGEIRSAFQSRSEITLQRIAELKYLFAFLDESLRMYPPAANNHPRRLPRQGATIAGSYVPGDAMVGINQYAMFRSHNNFHQPDQFRPERFLDKDDQRWSNDQREALQPFSFGPRNCIGRNLAYMEMRLIMTELLWNFDLELMPESEDWSDQKVFTVWEKKPLFVKLTPVRR
ncbi:hypothetical protein PFICI_06539 [Neofusicoccum parvum]|uniref:Uncharacterized protein n=1 Tax=Neofusicoccum parvum TaxID=310453 RepID=A0ACB5SH30_9PEZI|nr:hypothetical protein PFICI_06539 [Neofusicoccum parvum]